MNEELWNEYDREEVFCYLDVLRESGVTNMFGGGAYLQDEFKMTRREANSALTEWMQTFSERHPD